MCFGSSKLIFSRHDHGVKQERFLTIIASLPKPHFGILCPNLDRKQAKIVTATS